MEDSRIIATSLQDIAREFRELNETLRAILLALNGASQAVGIEVTPGVPEPRPQP